VAKFITLGNQFSSSFDQHYLFEDFTIQPNGVLKLSGLIESKKKNALKWMKEKMKLTGPNQEELPTLFYGGSIRVGTESPLKYTFGNNSNVTLHVERIALGCYPTLVNVEDGYSIGILDSLHIFSNGGAGWTLSEGEEIAIDVPFNLPIGSYLVADIIGLGDPGKQDELPVHFVQQHEDNRHLYSIPTLTEWGLIIFGLVLLGFISWVFLKRRKVIGVRV